MLSFGLLNNKAWCAGAPADGNNNATQFKTAYAVISRYVFSIGMLLICEGQLKFNYFVKTAKHQLALHKFLPSKDSYSFNALFHMIFAQS